MHVIKQYLLCLFLLSRGAGAMAQSDLPEDPYSLQRFDTLSRQAYTLPDPAMEPQTIVLQMDYAQPHILNPDTLKILSTADIRISSIDLVYTGDASAGFMSRLNRKRLQALHSRLPHVFSQKDISWKLVRQTGFISHADAAGMFHGFVIRYRRGRSPLKPTLKHFREDVDRLTRKPDDSTLFRSFSRNPQWSMELVVVDMTSSMSPYYKELVAWLNLKKTKAGTAFSLFNDGDNMPDDKKRNGNTGGVYTFIPPNLDTLISRMFQVARAGSGGDTPENDIEAILKGINMNMAIKEVILIADNNANMRDYVLIHLVTKPVRVILCGTRSGAVNTQYLDLARLSGGSVHTIEADILDLAKKREGDLFSIRGIQYQIRDGKVVRK